MFLSNPAKPASIVMSILPILEPVLTLCPPMSTKCRLIPACSHSSTWVRASTALRKSLSKQCSLRGRSDAPNCDYETKAIANASRSSFVRPRARCPISSSPSGTAFFRSVRADRLLTPCLPKRDGRRVLRLKMGLVANQVCSLEGGGEHTNPAKLFEMLEFPTSPPVNSTTRPLRVRHRDG